jgi:phenylalanyl-tRNA synthetase beta chain
LRERLIGLGYREILTIPHVAEDRDALFRPQGVTPARLSNPLSEEASVLKSTGIVTMAAALEWNLNHGQRNVRLFEIGSRYALTSRKPDEPEPRVLTIGATGEAREKGLYDVARDFCFADLKGDLDAIGQLACSSKEGRGIAWSPGGPDWLHAAHRGTVGISTTWIPIGVAGQLARRVADKFKLRQEVFLAELNLDPLYAAIQTAKESRRYEPLPRFPAVERDFSLLLAEGISFVEIAESIRSLNIPEIASIEAVDLFRGKNVPAGKYSLSVRLTFQSREGTLTEGQINHYTGKIISILEHRHSAQLRAG